MGHEQGAQYHVDGLRVKCLLTRVDVGPYVTIVELAASVCVLRSL